MGAVGRQSLELARQLCQRYMDRAGEVPALRSLPCRVRR